MTEYSRSNPFLARIKERVSLCKPGSQKNTQHIVLDLDGSDLTYQVGDCIAVYPVNDPELVQKTLNAIGASGDEIITQKRTDEEIAFLEFLTRKANITEFSKKFIMELVSRQSNTAKKAKLENILADKDHFKAYQGSHELWDALVENQEVIFTIQEISDLLMPLLPRFYSIASSMGSVGTEVHLTVALLQYQANEQQRLGVCTHYLCDLAPLNEPVIPIYIHPHSGFTLPEDHSASIIMVGPGTGIAPYRGFMQERLCCQAEGKNWLFFGEWHKNHNFFYEEFWRDLENQGKLKLDVAFSRDQQEKVYVQHKMFENGQELFKWLEEGAYFYVCGDAHRMAKDVEATLLNIIQNHGKYSEEQSKEYVKKLRKSKRYLRDVY